MQATKQRWISSGRSGGLNSAISCDSRRSNLRRSIGSSDVENEVSTILKRLPRARRAVRREELEGSPRLGLLHVLATVGTHVERPLVSVREQDLGQRQGGARVTTVGRGRAARSGQDRCADGRRDEGGKHPLAHGVASLGRPDGCVPIGTPSLAFAMPVRMQRRSSAVPSESRHRVAGNAMTSRVLVAPTARGAVEQPSDGRSGGAGRRRVRRARARCAALAATGDAWPLAGAPTRSAATRWTRPSRHSSVTRAARRADQQRHGPTSTGGSWRQVPTVVDAHRIVDANSLRRHGGRSPSTGSASDGSSPVSDGAASVVWGRDPSRSRLSGGFFRNGPPLP